MQALTDDQIQRLVALRDEYAREALPSGSDGAAERDLEYFDRIMEVLWEGVERE